MAGSVDSNNYCGNRFKDTPESEMTEEQMLLYRLMRGYDSATRPVFQATKPVRIRLGISLTQVLDVVSIISLINHTCCSLNVLQVALHSTTVIIMMYL